MKGGYIFDKDNVKFKKWRTPIKKRIRRTALFFVASLAMTVVYYLLFAMFFSTETERRLEAENEMFEREFPEFQKKEKLLADVIEGLKRSDDNIYKDIFHTSAPSLNPVTSVMCFSSFDSIPDHALVEYSERKYRDLTERASAVEDNFRRIAELLSDSAFVAPPMHNPLKDFTFAQTGASVGSKIDPFYKVQDPHNGLDIIAHSGEPVFVTADGVVSDVIMSRKGLGNVVVVTHDGGYVTRYAHLADIEVKKGKRLNRGDKIGCIGVSGTSFAPHLHYEVIRDTVVMDPVNHFFASFTPEEYVNVMIMAATTGQSLD